MRYVPAGPGRARLGLAGTLLPLLVLLLVNAAAVREMFRAGADAEAIAVDELRRDTEVQARSLEARLAALRGDFVYLSQSPPLSSAATALATDDPVAHRWSRLELEGSLILFLDGHPEVEELVVRTRSGGRLAAAARRDGAPVLLPPGERAPLDEQEHLQGVFALGQPEAGQGDLVAAVRATTLLSQVAPGLEDELRLTATSAEPPATRVTRDQLVVGVPVRDARWSPPVEWTLERRRSRGRLLESVAQLTSRYRTTLLLNLAVMLLAGVAAVLAVRQVRRTAALEAAQREQETIRQLERQLRHSERQGALGRLAAGLAHEINNPLEGLSNYVELLDDDLRCERTREAGELVVQLRRGLERIAGVVRWMLDFSSPSADRKAGVDVRETLLETVEFLRGSSLFREVEIRLSMPDERLPVVGDRSALGQLFLNLLLNACEIQQRKGRVDVAAAREQESVVITVVDHGPGIDPDKLERIFEPFHSGRGSTGLGLWVCERVVSEHSGTIRADNQAGAGGLFRVELPLASSTDAVQDGAAV